MTGWADTMIGDLLGGISQMTGTPMPLDPPIHDKEQLTPDQLSRLTQAGIPDPHQVSLAQINEVLNRPPKSITDPPGAANHNPLVLPPAPAPPAPPPPPRDDHPPPPPHGPEDEGMSGPAADAIKRLEAALAKQHSARNDADEQMAAAVLAAKTSNADFKQRLQDLKQDIIDEVKKLDPVLDTADGQRQLAEFLKGKAGQILDASKTYDLDQKSQAALMDAIDAQYRALAAEAGGNGTNPGAQPAVTAPAGGASPGTNQPGAGQPGATTPGGQPGGGQQQPGQAVGQTTPDDSLLGGGGLPSDGAMAGLGPALSSLGAIPGSFGGGGGGMPLGMGGGMPSFGDLADAGEHHHHHHADDDDDEFGHEHEKAGKEKESPEQKGQQPGAQQPGAQPPVAQPGGQVGAGGAEPPPVAAAVGQQPIQPPAQVTVPGTNEVRTASSPALAQAGREVFSGESIDDAYSKNGLQLPPVGALPPAGSPTLVAPGKLEFGDVGQFTDHRVMALGKTDVWLNGQATPLDKMETGPNFVGWIKSTPVAAAVPAAVPPPAPPTT